MIIKEAGVLNQENVHKLSITLFNIIIIVGLFRAYGTLLNLHDGYGATLKIVNYG